jgi:glycosyltransferase involved in cell wall biosynthesis
MKIAILTNYYHPESIGAGIWVTQLAQDLRARAHAVTVITSFPSYPQRTIYPGFRNCFSRRDIVDGIEVIRTLTYASPSNSFWSRLAGFGIFCISAVLGYLPWRRRFDVVYAILPPLPLGVSGWLIAVTSGARLVVNIQDIYPDVAVALNYLTNPAAVALFKWMERWIYQRADRIVVISEGFRKNLLAKGTAPQKLQVVPNWADPNAFSPTSSDNSFRKEIGANGKLLVLYSGGLTHNSDLEPVLDAALELRGCPIQFAIVGDGVHKHALMEKARAAYLDNVKFYPFQPLERYGEVLASADVTLVALNSAATFASVPSKIYKQMAAARPIIAITADGNELSRLVNAAGCGFIVPPGDSRRLAAVLLQALRRRDALSEMGLRGRAYLQRNCTRERCVARIEAALSDTCIHMEDRSILVADQHNL